MGYILRCPQDQFRGLLWTGSGSHSEQTTAACALATCVRIARRSSEPVALMRSALCLSYFGQWIKTWRTVCACQPQSEYPVHVLRPARRLGRLLPYEGAWAQWSGILIGYRRASGNWPPREYSKLWRLSRLLYEPNVFFIRGEPRRPSARVWGFGSIFHRP